MDIEISRELIGQAQIVIQGVNESLSPTSAKSYTVGFARMQKTGLSPEKIANTSRSFYFYRAALIHHHASSIRSILREIDNSKECDNKLFWAEQAEKLSEHIAILKKYKPDPTRMHIKQGIVGNWSVEAEKRERAGNKIRSHSKRSRLRHLPIDWRTQMFEGIGQRSKYRTAFALLSLTGARPSEFELGINVALEKEGHLQITIRGTKTHNGKYGQDTRVLTVLPETKEAQFLVSEIHSVGGPIIVSANPGSLCDRVNQISKKVFPRLKSPISAYVFRHQISANLKASNMDSKDVSAALGHSTDVTKRYYGTASSAKGASGITMVKASRPVKELTMENIRELEAAREYSQTKELER